MKGRSDSNYTTNVETRKSISSIEVILNSVPVVMNNVEEKIISLLVTKAELITIAQVVQEMLYVIRILESINLKVQKLIIVERDNKDTIDLYNS